MGLISRVRGNNPLHVPASIADAVELWARQYGRHARITWVTYPTMPPVPQVRISPAEDDPIRARVANGELAPAEAEETVELMEFDPEKGSYVPLDLNELGVSGVLARLREGDTWSGSGRFGSLEEASRFAREQTRENRRSAFERGKQQMKDVGRAVRRQLLDLPFKAVGIDLTSDSRGAETSPDNEE